MTFLYPLGFLALLAIPCLILIYIIKSKYTEQTVTSTYLWTLSEKFLKRRNPIRKITGIISLILQIFAVLFIAVSVAHPVFTLPGKAQDYCFVLDGSGSMNTVQSGSTRFEIGKSRISDMISSAADGSTFTLITTGNTTDMVMKEVTDKKSAIRQLGAVQPSYVASGLSGAVEAANKYFEENPACKFYVFTDKFIEEENVRNAELINISEEVSNYALDDVKYTITKSGVTVNGKAFSYIGNAEFTVGLFIDGSENAATTAQVSVSAGVGAEFTLSAENNRFTSLRVAIMQSDGLSLDNEVVLYNNHSDTSYKTLIVSNTPFFTEISLISAGHTQIEKIKPEDYKEDTKGYGLYVFQNFTPKSMPTDGAVWFINPDSGVDSTSGFTRGDPEQFENPVGLRQNNNTSTKVRKLLKDTVKEDEIYINEYLKCSTYREFTALMYCGGDPVILAGSNAYGNREVVFAFDFIETSDFALSYNGPVIMRNLVAYTFPDLVDETLFYSGDTLAVNVLANCTEIRVEKPSGKADYIDTSVTISEYELTEVGEYTVTAIIGNNRQSVKVFSQLPAAERTVTATEAAFLINGEPSAQKRDGKYEDMLYLFIILAVIVVADWMVYCYEQYQLR